jgi:ABC-type lipoprotein release transport system permease subunit
VAALALIVPTVIATFVPAMRAAEADPVVAMRVE